MQDLIKRINKQLDNLSFEALFSGFTRLEIAIYSENLLYFKDRIIPFSVQNNVAILQEVDINMPISVLAADAVREMFIIFLSKNYKKHFPNDFNVLDYPDNYLNLDYMSYEKKLLMKSYKTMDLNVKLNYLRMFMNVRGIRKTIIGEAIKEEYRLETIRGLTLYVYYKALKKLNHKQSEKFLKESFYAMEFFSKEYFDIRHLSYFVGTTILLILEDLKIKISQYDLKNRTIFETMLGKINYIDEMINYMPTEGLYIKFKRYREEVKNVFIDFFAYKTKKVSGEFIITQYDPEGMMKIDNQIYHSSFVALEDLNGKKIFINGPVITRVDDNNKCICYFQKVD